MTERPHLAPPDAPEPPRLAEWLLARALPAGNSRDGLLGDLREELARRAHDTPGWRAAAWYWREAMAASARWCWERAVRGAPMGRRPSDSAIPIESQGDPFMSTLWSDLRFAARTLRRSPGFTVVAALTLALGIGANATVFSIADAFLLRPLPFADSERLVHVWGTNPRRDAYEMRVSLPTFEQWKRDNRAFSDMALFNYTEEDLADGNGEPVRASVGRLSANAFRLLGVAPRLGRGFVDGEDQPGAPRVAVLSDGLWRARYGARADILGATVRINDQPHTVIGVMPPGFAFPLNITQLWAPYSLDPALFTRDRSNFQVVARLAPGVSMAQARTLMDQRTEALAAEDPSPDGARGANVVPLRHALNFAYDVLAPMAVFLAAAAALVLLIACANVAGIMLSRATGRSREMAIRAALGAGRRRILRQLLTESVLLGVVGGALGIALAIGTLRFIDGAIPPDIYRAGPIGVSIGTLTFTVLVALVAAVLFGLAPALHASRVNLAERLQQGGGRTASAGRGVRRVHGALVVAQMSVTVALLVGSALMVRSLRALRAVDPGFEPSRVLTLKLVVPAARYPDPARVRQLHANLVREVEAQPGVRSAATVDYLPLNHETNRQEFVADGAAPRDGENPSASVVTVSAQYFATMGIPLLRGRAFTAADDSAAANVVIINDAMRRRYWPKGEVVGRTVRLVRGGEPVPFTIVGIAGDARHVSLDGPPEPQMYVAQRQRPTRYFRLLVRGDGAPESLAGAARRAVAAVDPAAPVTELRGMQGVVDEFLLPQRGLSGLLATFAGGALLLALIGIYGVMAYLVAQRTHEIGVRVALGATRRDVLALVLGRGLLLAAVGAAVGAAAALGLTRLLAGFLHGVSATDPATYVALSIGTIGVALLACYIPARRALRVEPVIALRAE